MAGINSLEPGSFIHKTKMPVPVKSEQDVQFDAYMSAMFGPNDGRHRRSGGARKQDRAEQFARCMGRRMRRGR